MIFYSSEGATEPTVPTVPLTTYELETTKGESSSSATCAAENVTVTMHDKAPMKFEDGESCFSLPIRFQVQEQICMTVVKALEKFLNYKVNLSSYTKVNRVSLSIYILLNI